MFVHSLPEIAYSVSAPSDRVALWHRPIWLLEHPEELGNLQSSTQGWLPHCPKSLEDKGEKGFSEEIGGLFPLL